jgi:hypothetical protein
MNGLAQIKLDGTGSYDPDGDTLEYFWYDANDLIATGAEPNVIFPIGEHVIDLIVNDGQVDSEPNDVMITVIGPLEVHMTFMPQILNPKTCGRYVMAVITLPQGVSIDDLDPNQPWRLLPGDVEALFARPFRNWRWRREMVFTIFDRDEVMDAIDCNLIQPKCRFGGRGPFWPIWFPPSTEVQITVYGKFQSGQWIGGTDTIRIIQPIRPLMKSPHHRYRQKKL